MEDREQREELEGKEKSGVDRRGKVTCRREGKRGEGLMRESGIDVVGKECF